MFLLLVFKDVDSAQKYEYNIAGWTESVTNQFSKRHWENGVSSECEREWERNRVSEARIPHLTCFHPDLAGKYPKQQSIVTNILLSLSLIDYD